MIRLYSTNCPKCNVLKKKLEEKNIIFELIEDINTVIEFGASVNKNTAPLLVTDDTILEFQDAVKWLSNY